MTIRVHLRHDTIYKYDRKVFLSPHIFRIRPAPHCRTPIESYSMKILPQNHFINWQQDPFGNYLARVVFPEKTDILSISVEIIAKMSPINPFDFFLEESAKNYPFSYNESLKKELAPYLEIEESNETLLNWVEKIKQEKVHLIDFLVDVNKQTYNHLKYQIRLEPGTQTCAETLKLKSGSCRDFAWLMVQTMRHLGIAARFVSGYLIQLTADIPSLDGPSGPEKDFTDLHAWCEVYIPGAGWIGLDATSGLLAGEGHIPLACTPNYESAAVISGSLEKCEVDFRYKNEVKRISETPRVTKPYTEEQWEEIYKLGFQVDEELKKNDVRLTMGGEPTFVSIDDMESPEWNTEADGKQKRILAENLSRRLLNAFGKGGVIQHSQGKWYPGESLPRWQIGIFWRKDGKPIWQNPSLLANPHQSSSLKTEDSLNFINTLCKFLGISSLNVLPAFEDVYYMLWEEGNLPLDMDIFKEDLKNDYAREALRESLERGLEAPKGYVLPLNWGLTRWITSKWEFRRKHLFLTPGTSPIGLRLPLKSLIIKPHIELEVLIEPQIFYEYPALGEYYQNVKKRVENYSEKILEGTRYFEFVRTALCVEIRNGNLHIFLPPIGQTEAYLDLIAAIEVTAETLKIPVILEGYEPVKDNRLESIKITPDPGVIEVNIHPSKNWKELVSNIETLYEEARFARLGTEKFMLDGKHTGTGGGNHITLGGETPADSPFLRNPQLLRSMITFWQHHPGLSYLFSGAFIGPTSQAPRVDEGRMENLYELEIAFSQIPHSEYAPFWLVDRLFRHLLTDITGNTHRAEFCIDKLYSPDSSSGRLGIIEMRAFDMPPHFRMSIVQMLLVRSLIAWFWKKPYFHDLVRWGTRLYDHFMLEHFVREDIKDIITQLNQNGYSLKEEWFEPFFEFRFPIYGNVVVNGIQVEIRSAIEPWHVLGEEVTGQGTTRYVDSSVERLQIKVKNFNQERYLITCNGVMVPMNPTGIQGEYVAGVRYKAWQPWSALHPTIGVDTPLVFDIVDKWNHISVGGFTYFVSHPGGRSYEVFPVNSFEADARRSSRFWEIGQTQVSIETQTTPSEKHVNVQIHDKKTGFQYIELPKNLEYSCTLDLRRRWKR